MKLKNFIKKWGINNLKLKSSFMEVDLTFEDADKNAAWELYIELLTRITTQYLEVDDGDEATALKSIHKMFELTRDIIKRNGRECINFTKIAIPVLNQIIRPFTAKWHKLSLEGCFEDHKECLQFRTELILIQENLKKYTQMLADMADVEDLTELEN